MSNRVTNPQYGVVAGRYLYRKTKKERMTLKTKFPCVAVLRDEDSLLKDLGYSYGLRTKKLFVVALRGNQDPRHYRPAPMPVHLRDVTSYCKSKGIKPIYPPDWKGERARL